MKRKIKILSFLMVAVAFGGTVVTGGNVNSCEQVLVTAVANEYYAAKAEETTASSLGGIGDALGSIGSGSSGIGDVLGGIGSGSSGIGDALGGIGSGSSGIGDAIGGLGDSLGGVFSDAFGEKTTIIATTEGTTALDPGLIIPVPAATQTEAQTTEAVSKEASTEGETVDFAATSNPYTKPTAAFSAGDEDETIKWLQWIFIYTDYGLEFDGITGVLDEATVAVVKKLQKEKGLTIDGNITEEVINAAEILYYQSVWGEEGTAVEVSLEQTTGAVVQNTEVVEGNGKNVSVVLLIVVLVLIWLFAVVGIVLLFVMKKKKLDLAKQQRELSNENKNTKGAKSESTEGISSLSDLFEDAENKK